MSEKVLSKKQVRDAGYDGMADVLAYSHEALRAERDAALAELADIKASYRATTEEPCDAGQVHCTCVPALRAEVERMREHADMLADAIRSVMVRGITEACLDQAIDAHDALRASAQKEGE